MNDFKFTKREKVYLLLACLILVMLFISSSMTYHEQKMKPGFIHTYLGWLEELIHKLNSELSEAGFIITPGRIDKDYFESKIYFKSGKKG